MNKKKNVIILQDEISPYNVPFFNELTKSYDLTIGYFTKDKSASDCFFNKHMFKVSYLGPLFIVHNVYNYCKPFDVVVTNSNLHNPSYWTLPFKRHKYSILSWSIGFRVSYIHPYIVSRKHNILDSLFMRMINKCDASVFYMEKSKDFWQGTKLNLNKVFVAPNTTEVLDISFAPDKKKDFIFVGTLYRGKGVDLLIEAFASAKTRVRTDIRLHIVGAGEEKKNLESMVVEKGLYGSVIFHGAIFDEAVLAQLFQTALLSFSPTQAGLSVPKSMGYGVPFVTRHDSITGGEIYHITNGVNGIIYQDNSELEDIMVEAMESPEKFIQMGSRAKQYYQESASIAVMARGMSDAIEFALNAHMSH